MGKKKIIIWGHKLYSHTQSFVHYGFYRAFIALGHDVLWVDEKDDVSNLNFDNCIFMTEGQVDKTIPLNKSCKYIVHSANEEKYSGYHKINIQIFHGFIDSKDPIPHTHPSFSTSTPLSKINDYTYICHHTVFQPWATDLLPDEIDLNTANNELVNRECVWVGTYGDKTSIFQNSLDLDLFFDECKKNNISIKIINPWVSPAIPEENRRLVNKAFFAPALQGPWQINHGYAPQCRILKNISYGHFGITNNPAVNKLFDNMLVYDSNPVTLFLKSLEKKNDPKLLDEIKYLMNEIKNKHTYINRAKVILSALGE